ncbi:hypothetical protein HMPREF9406_1136 [Clostridium sp. HGF2]|nr:hypothetical protein HMPREF9406_1136 [Clostridium sp. HGF2]EQJ52251.1 hypothetical protein QSI_3872 [Clostridioides difficile P28]
MDIQFWNVCRTDVLALVHMGNATPYRCGRLKEEPQNA